MTESEKQEILADYRAQEENADKLGLYATAQWWHERHDIVEARPAEDIILAKHKLPKPGVV